MINFVNVLLQNSKLMQAKIYKAAAKAAENPSIGITINNPAASQVIKDCATITMTCLPLYVFAEYKDPFRELSGKFAKQDINEFVGKAKDDTVLNLLLTAILYKAEKQLPGIFSQTKSSEAQPLDISDDPYGDYVNERVVVETRERSTEEILQEAFKC
jgi:hypothetical protein